MPPEEAPAPSDVDGSADRCLRFVTWNCHGSVGRDGRCRPERVLSVIHRLQPDLLALQEIDGRAHFGRRERAFEWFAEHLGPHVAEARTVRRTNRDYGHLLWSRWPFRSPATIDLPGRGFEPRMAIEAEVETRCGPITVLAAHLGLSPFARKTQAEFLAARAAAARQPVIVLGDTNAWRLSGPVDDALRAVCPVAVTPQSFPARRPLLRMDRIHAGPQWALRQGFADTEAATASDHLPVVADLILRP